MHNAKIATNSIPSFVEAIAIKDGKISASGKNDEILRLRGPATRVIDAKEGRLSLDSTIRTCTRFEAA